MAKQGRRASAMALTGAALLGVGASAAAGATPSTSTASLSTVQSKAAAAITLRVNNLNAAIATVNGSKVLGSDAAGLATYLQIDIDPLQQLGQKIAADTTVAQAETDAATIYSSYRVLALVLPSARLAADADAITNRTVPTLTADAAKAASHVTSANQATLQPLITDLNGQITSATNATSGLATTVLSYSPAQWNTNHNLLASSRSSLASAKAAAAKARSDLRQIRSDLRS